MLILVLRPFLGPVGDTCVALSKHLGFCAQVRQEIDRRIQEKEEEFDHSKKNHARALDSMQASLEAEARAKEEALRQVLHNQCPDL